MYLRTTENNDITLVSTLARQGTVQYQGEFPEDFLDTFSRGKYLFVDGDIVQNPSWSEANGELLTLPEDIPHRQVLISAGISSTSELQGTNDWTTIDGIGPSKAQDLQDYFNT